MESTHPTPFISEPKLADSSTGKPSNTTGIFSNHTVELDPNVVEVKVPSETNVNESNIQNKVQTHLTERDVKHISSSSEDTFNIKENDKEINQSLLVDQPSIQQVQPELLSSSSSSSSTTNINVLTSENSEKPSQITGQTMQKAPAKPIGKTTTGKRKNTPWIPQPIRNLKAQIDFVNNYRRGVDQTTENTLINSKSIDSNNQNSTVIDTGKLESSNQNSIPTVSEFKIFDSEDYLIQYLSTDTRIRLPYNLSKLDNSKKRSMIEGLVDTGIRAIKPLEGFERNTNHKLKIKKTDLIAIKSEIDQAIIVLEKQQIELEANQKGEEKLPKTQVIQKTLSDFKNNRSSKKLPVLQIQALPHCKLNFSDKIDLIEECIKIHSDFGVLYQGLLYDDEDIIELLKEQAMKAENPEKKNNGIGEAPYGVAVRIGLQWVGNDFSILNEERALISKNRQYQFRLPSKKSRGNGIQANFEYRPPKYEKLVSTFWQLDSHMVIRALSDKQINDKWLINWA